MMEEYLEAVLRGGLFKKILDERAAECRRRYGLKRAEVEILYFLSASKDKNTATDVHHCLMMNRGHISQAMESLCEKQYLKAVPDKDDRRYIHFFLTETANEVVRDLKARRGDMMEKLFEGLTEEQIETYKSITKQIWANMEKYVV